MTGPEKIDADSRNEEPQMRFSVVHGHFYQPPRENPWLDSIETQPSAAPDHDWNERIFQQCYRPNAYSRILDSDGMITDIQNNYRFMSYNFGPTLFSWLEKHHSDVAERIIEGDRDSMRRFNGHGNAMAQVYNHMIMPLASRRDQITQIRWGKEFFRARFGREPEGMWLAETAINMETVNCLVEEGIRYVILAPTQVEAFRPLEEEGLWVSTSQSGVDPRRAYRVFPTTAAGRRHEEFLDVFLFDQPLSREASFGELLSSSEGFASRLSACLDSEPSEPQLCVLATDGETFGHHKPFGDMCLAFYFADAAAKAGIMPVNFGYFLEQSPPAWELRLVNAFDEGSAWSCAHGTGRWARDCGCQTGGDPAWNQRWRKPLREALDTLQREVDAVYAHRAAELVVDPWKLRNDFGAFADSPTIEKTAELLRRNGAREPDEATSRELLRLLLAQKYMLFSYTSCGWFFADVSGIETVQNLNYAFRAIQLAFDGSDTSATTQRFLSELEKAASNLNNDNARSICERWVIPNLRHREILCFTAAVKRVLFGEEELDKQLFGFAIQLMPVDISEGPSEGSARFTAHIDNTSTGENGTYTVQVGWQAGIEAEGYVVPHEADEPEQEGKHATAIGLADLWQESRFTIAHRMLDNMKQEALESYAPWASVSRNRVAYLSGLSVPIPRAVLDPIIHEIHREWDMQIERLRSPGREDQVREHLTELKEMLDRLHMSIDLAHTATVIEELIATDLDNLRESLSTRHSDRMRALLNIVDRFCIPLAKGRLEDAFFDILNTRVGDLYRKVTTTNESTAEQRALLAAALSFARRMNFSTARMPLSRLIEEAAAEA